MGQHDRPRIGSREAREMARKILDSPEYQASLKSRAAAGTLPAAIEAMLWHYRYGKPPSQIVMDVTRTEDYSVMSANELAERARQISEDMQQVREFASEILDSETRGVN